jgi:hypothetical protein
MRTILTTMALSVAVRVCADPVVIDHRHGNPTFFKNIPQSYIQAAKDKLHIAYGHTSHGSQLTSGMNSLVDFINGGGLGMSCPTDFYDWNNGGSGGALDLHDYAMAGDVGYYPQWVNETHKYLTNPVNSNVNVIVWSWCGQVTWKYNDGTLSSQYLLAMNQLESAYPHVMFVYMTGHLDHPYHALNTAANQCVRDYCAANDKILYDFADIESYNPDGTYFEFAHDNCNYYSSADDTTADGNWATEWQNSHTQDVEWFNCSAAHSEALNGNLKAYGAWALWAELAMIPEPCGGMAAVLALASAAVIRARRSLL